MICPTLRDLPLPPSGKTGWPWTEETPPSQDTMSKSLELPKISIVTPSYNQGQFLEETIRSVLLQGYPNLEYIIIDGGSTDNSVEIIRKYEPWLTYWISEKDNGQSHAINKGWKVSSGEIIAYLNSDDTYMPGAINYASKYFIHDAEAEMIYSGVHIINECSEIVTSWPPRELDVKKYIVDDTYYIPQQGVFFRKSLLEKVGFLDENLHYKMDRDFFIRAGQTCIVHRMPEYLGNFRSHSQSKSTFQYHKQNWEDFLQISKKHGGYVSRKVHIRHYLYLMRQVFLVEPLLKFNPGKRIVNWIRHFNNKRELQSLEKRLR